MTDDGDRRLGSVSVVPAGPGVVVGEVDFRACSLIDGPQAALSDEGARHLVLHRPHRVTELAFHRLPLADHAPGYLDRRGRSCGQEPCDLGIGDHREPWFGIAGLKGADDQACCLKPRAHDQIIRPAIPSRACPASAPGLASEI